MNQEAQQRLENLLNREVATWSEQDRAFVRARRSYLNADQKKRFAGVLKGASEADSELEDLTVDQLKEMCEERGLKVSGTKSELIERIEEHDSQE